MRTADYAEPSPRVKISWHENPFRIRAPRVRMTAPPLPGVQAPAACGAACGCCAGRDCGAQPRHGQIIAPRTRQLASVPNLGHIWRHGPHGTKSAPQRVRAAASTGRFRCTNIGESRFGLGDAAGRITLWGRRLPSRHGPHLATRRAKKQERAARERSESASRSAQARVLGTPRANPRRRGTSAVAPGVFFHELQASATSRLTRRIHRFIIG